MPNFKIAPAQRREVRGVRVTVTREFKDIENDLALRTVGEKLNLPPARAQYLAAVGVVKITEQEKGGDPKSPDETQG